MALARLHRFASLSEPGLLADETSTNISCVSSCVFIFSGWRIRKAYILVKPVGQSKVRQLLTWVRNQKGLHFSKTSWSV